MGKKKYERPTIVRHTSGLGNKFGRVQRSRIKKEINGVLVKDLTRQYGSPVFVFSEKIIRTNYRRALNAFSVRYPKVQFAWSYKTNYLDAVCRIFHQEGSWAEVVSEFEYDMAKRNGIAGEKIIYNGPYKPEAALYTAVRDGSRIHIDNYDELYLLEKISKDIGKPVNVGIRINMDTGIYPAWDRFGFNLDNGEALNAVRRIQAGGRLKLTGFHSHIGTFVTEPAAYRNGTSKLAAFAASMNKEFGFNVAYIDVGGGFASKNTLHDQYAPGRETNPTIEDYADAVTAGLLEHGFLPDQLPMLILETGRALIDEAGYLLTTVVANKRLPNGSHTMIVDAGVNLLFTSLWYKHDVMLSEEKEGLMEEKVIYGPLCMNIDVVRPAVNLPVMDSGDVLVIHPVGAYNVTQWMQFIRMRPAVVLVGENRVVDIIREAESLDMVKNPEHVPERLKDAR